MLKIDKLIETLKEFDKQRDEQLNSSPSTSERIEYAESIAKCFLPVAQKILGGHFEVSLFPGNKVRKIYPTAIELYYHEERENGFKDPIMYHTQGRHMYELGKKKEETRTVLTKLPLPYFPIGALNTHQSGVDITFENSEKGKEYRASFLIREYKVMYEDGDVRNVKNSTEIYDDMFVLGITDDDTKYLKWVEDTELDIFDVQRDWRRNVPDYESDGEWWKPIEATDTEKSFSSKGKRLKRCPFDWKFTKKSSHDDTRNRINKVFFSAKLPEVCPIAYKEVTKILDKYGVQHGLLQGTKDIWVRDFMPLQVRSGRLEKYDYNPDYLRNYKKYIPLRSDPEEVCKANGIKTNDSIASIKIDGGNVVHCGTKVIMTSKVFEENPAIPIDELVRKLENCFGANIVFIPWDTYEIYGHADGVVRFVDENTVIMTNYGQLDKAMGERFRNILRSRFTTVHELHYDVPEASKNNWAYINWLQTDKVIILPKFGIPEDEQALKQISEWMPEYRGRIEMADASDLITGGGCFNCATWTIFDEKSADKA